MKLLFGIALILLGLCALRFAIRQYTEDPVDAVLDDIWDYLNGRMLTIVFGLALMLWGAGLIYTFFRPDLSFEPKSSFPFVEMVCLGPPPP